MGYPGGIEFLFCIGIQSVELWVDGVCVCACLSIAVSAVGCPYYWFCDTGFLETEVAG